MLLHHLLHLGAVERVDRELGLFRLGQKLLVLQRGDEGIAQELHRLRRRAGRGDIGPAEHLLAEHELDRLSVLFLLDELPDFRNAALAQLRIRLERELRQDVHFVVADPVRLLRFQARPVPAAHAVDLAALDRQRHFGGAFVAGNEIELRAGGLAHEVDVVAAGAARRARAHRAFLLLRVLEGLDLGGDEGGADAGDAVGGGEIDELGRIVLRLLAVLQAAGRSPRPASARRWRCRPSGRRWRDRSRPCRSRRPACSSTTTMGWPGRWRGRCLAMVRA